MMERNPITIPAKTRISARKNPQDAVVYSTRKLTLEFHAHAVPCDDEIGLVSI